MRKVTKGKMKTKQISALLENANFCMSDDWDKARNKNLEQLIIPQLSVLHKVMHRGTRTQRPAASRRENHCSHCGQPGHRRSHGSPITCPTLLQIITPTSFKTSSTVASTSHTSQPPAHASPPCLHILKPLLPKHTLLLSGRSLSVNNRRLLT